MYVMSMKNPRLAAVTGIPLQRKGPENPRHPIRVLEDAREDILVLFFIAF